MDISPIDDTFLRGILNDQSMRLVLLEEADPVVARAQRDAPKRTGRGAASIRAEAVLDGREWVVYVSWSQDRYYMYFQERGTSRGIEARPFLVPSLLYRS